MLSGQAAERLEDGPGVVLAPPGDAFADAYAELAPSSPDARLDFGAALPDSLDAAAYPALDEDRLKNYPVYVCVMSAEAAATLEDALDAIPEERYEDLVILQRGEMIEPALKRRGLGRERQTQATLYVGVNEYGKLEDDRCGLGEDAMGELKYAAESCVTGKWAGAVADRLRRAGFFCAEFFHRDWRRQMIEAVVFESVYGLVGAVHKNVPVSEVAEFFGDEVDDMLYEIQRGLRGHLAVTLLSGFEERMAAYAETQKRSKTDNREARASKTSPFRNNFFYAISTDALAKDFPDPSPMHTEYWEYASENGMLDD